MLEIFQKRKYHFALIQPFFWFWFQVPDVYKDNCKPETWKECHGHGYETYCAPFVKDTVECDVDFKIPYCQCKKIPVPVKLKKVTCKPKVVAVCEPVTERICSKG